MTLIYERVGKKKASTQEGVERKAKLLYLFKGGLNGWKAQMIDEEVQFRHLISQNGTVRNLLL